MARKHRPMPWESTVPNVLAGEAQKLACQPMDNEQFAAFYERSARSLWAYLARVSRDPALADDLTQESYVRFLCAEHPEDGEVAARRYLFRIATNLLRDHWRRPHASSIDEVPEENLMAKCGVRASRFAGHAGPGHGAIAAARPATVVAGLCGGLLSPRNCRGHGAGFGKYSAAALSRTAQSGAPVAGEGTG